MGTVTRVFESVYRRFESYRPSSEGLGVACEGGTMPEYVTPVTWLEAPAWLTMPEAARLAGLSCEAVRWLVEDGSIEAQGAGDDLRIDKASLSEWLEALEDVAYTAQAIQDAENEAD